ncbi:MAG: ABC transporter substrate-binding protein [Clostridia bacterium]|nr:ABC transporter substrate-binding protein [Clostridia bacterium]
MARRFWCVLLALCVLLLSGGCDEVPDLDDLTTDPTGVGDDAPSDTPEEELVFALPYSHDDTLNPFTSATEVNLQLSHLLYDSLTVIADGCVPQLSLASEVALTDPTHLTVTLREGAVFSDGSAVTAEDVAKSFQEAKDSPHYRVLLTNVTAAKADGKKRRITFTLASADVNAQACLTFPVVKAATLTDAAAKAPVGGGLYTTASDDGGLRLIKNPHHPTAVNFPVIALRHLPNTAARYYALASGRLAYCFDDLSEGEEPRITGASRPVMMNAMVFLGINGAHKPLALPAVRQALSLLLDRSALAAIYGERGVPSASPLPTLWQPMKELAAPTAEQDAETALAMLADAGYPLTDKKQPEWRLIYNSDRADRGAVAERIRTQAAACGLKIVLKPMGEAEYRQCLEDGDYELYLGEFRFGADMSLRSLLTESKTAYGVAADSAAKRAYAAYLSGQDSLQAFLDAFGTDAPFIPLCYRGGVAAYDRRLTSVTPTGFDPYYGIAGWK